MKRLKLNLDQLGKELEMLDNEHLRGIKGGWDGGYGAYGGYNSWEELWEAMQNGYVPPEGDYNPGGYGGYGDYGWGDYGSYGGYNGGWPGWYPPDGDYGGYNGGGYGGYGGYSGSSAGTFPELKFSTLWNSYPADQYGNTQNITSDPNFANANQCAMRMGYILKSCYGVSFGSEYTNNFGPTTSDGLPRGAQSLADFLEEKTGASAITMTYSEFIGSSYYDQNGIIFFDEIDGVESNNNADHIDLWDGSSHKTKTGSYPSSLRIRFIQVAN